MSAIPIPPNPCPPKTVAWTAWEVLSGRKPSTGEAGHYFAFSVPVEREAVEAEVREEFRLLTIDAKHPTGQYHTLDTISRMIRGGTQGFLNWYAATVGYELQAATDEKGKRLDGRVRLVRLAEPKP